MSSYTYSPDWQISQNGVGAQHKSGLSIFLHKGAGAKNKKPQIDIQGIEKLSGTPWALRANAVIEQGIALLETLKSA